MQISEWRCVTCHFFLAPKNHFLHPSKTCDHYGLIFYPLLHQFILLFFRFEFAQESKKFQKMDIDDVQNRHRRKTFGKNRRALGILRNFLGPSIGRPYMQWGNIHAWKSWKLTKCQSRFQYIPEKIELFVWNANWCQCLPQSTTLDPNNVCPSSFPTRSSCQVQIPCRIHFKKNAR